MRETRSRFESPIRRAVWVSAYIALYLLAVRFITEPLHVRGWFQPMLGAVNALGYMLEFPGSAVAGMINRRATEHAGAAQWWLSLTSNVVLYTAGLYAVTKIRTASRTESFRRIPTPRSEADLVRFKASDQQAVYSRRQFIHKGADLAAGGALGSGFGYALLLEPGNIQTVRVRIPIRNLPTELVGLRIAQVSDVHHGPWLGLERVKEVVRLTNALQADLICLTGDYVYDSAKYIDPVIEALAQLKAKIGIVGVLGNHDWWDRGVPMKAAFKRWAIPLIDNSRLILTNDRQLVPRATEGLCIAGVGDLWEDVPDYHAALTGLPVHMPRLLLAHNPDCAEDPLFLREKQRVDLMLSGHTHGGQVWIPGVGTPIVPSRYGQKYASGLVQGPLCPVYVSKGIGLSGLPIRFGVLPEIVVLELIRSV